MKPLTIGYFADGPWSHLALEKLVADPTLRVAFICARFDRTDACLRDRSKIHAIDFFTHQNINSEECFQKIAGYDCDLLVSMSFNQIFRKRLIEHPRLKIINCHAGKLPFYRGRNILNWALINDEKEFGVTIHYVDGGIDTGDILAQCAYPITDADTYATLLDRAYIGCSDLLYNTIKELQAGRIFPIPQAKIHPTGFYCTARVKGDERLNWNQPSRDVFNFVRAICRPGPEARTFTGETEIRINRVELAADAPRFKGISGAILHSDGKSLAVKTADSFVRVVEWSCPKAIRIGDRLT